jgi:segregation and condensation protein B
MPELDSKRIIEAALFMSSKPLEINDLARVSGIGAVGFVESLIKQLQEEYNRNGSALQIFFENGKYIMRVRSDYEKAVSGLAKESEISKGALKTLAVIAKNDGMKQSKIVEMLGTTVYDHVKELVEKEFITAEKQGRTRVLKITNRFKEYFSV